MIIPRTDINGIHVNIVNGSTKGIERQVDISTKRMTLTSILFVVLKLVIIAAEMDSATKQIIWVHVGLGTIKTGMRARIRGISVPQMSTARSQPKITTNVLP